MCSCWEKDSQAESPENNASLSQMPPWLQSQGMEQAELRFRTGFSPYLSVFLSH
jgi:hypothetical protein